MNERDIILISVLAATDAVWTPNRTNLPVVDDHRRAAGVPWNSRLLAGATDRKAVQRLLADLRLGDFLTASNPSGTRTTAVRLTHAGDDHARARAGLPLVYDTVDLLQQIAGYRDHPDGSDFCGEAYTPETALAGVEWGNLDQGPALADVQIHLLPALVRGLAVSRCSIHRHCWYAVTPAGLAFIDNPPKRPKRLAAESDAAWDLYVARIQAERVAMANAQPGDVNGIGEIPMPVCPERRGGKMEVAHA